MSPPPLPPVRLPWYRILYVQVLIGVFLGVVIGAFFPTTGVNLKPLGDGFVNLVKMIIAPIIFLTVVHGVASMADLKKLGWIGVKTILYFEIVSTLALVIGLIVANVFQPGASFHADLGKLDTKAIQGYVQEGQTLSATEFFLNIIPKSFFSAFASGDILQVLLVSILTAFAISAMGARAKPILTALDYISEIFFGIIRIIVRLAPIGAMGAMAFTVGSYGLGALKHLASLMFCFYLTAIVFVVGVLGSIALFNGFSIFRFILYIKSELLLVLGTSSSETALPGILEKMRRLGCAPQTVGVVVPTGYSFNLDGTNIYMSMAAIFLAQATNTHLDLRQQITLLLVAMISSKGAAAVTGAGFVTLAATLGAVKGVPPESIALIFGIDRFMSECRALTNLVGNGVATVVISRSEGEVTSEELRRRMVAVEPA
ncbi:MAG TPA: C4-dicarboxylate transporter DctA [Chthoniobacteraceae bacterium]